MSDSASQRSPRERQIDALILEYEQAAEQGRPLNQEEFLRQHAEFAPELREYFENCLHVQELAQVSHIKLDETEPISGSTPQVLRPGQNVRYFGDYEILEELGHGGMGVVYKARQSKLKKIVALKMIKVGQLASEAEVRRFQAEARAAARLDHPGIVAVHEVGIDHGQHYYAMDYVAGGSLSALYREQPVAARHAAELVKKLAEAMHYAHSKGIVHRDLKPANVLLTTTGVPRITDFGLAKRLWTDDDSTGVTMTETGQVLGTAGYMSPEQAAGKNGVVSTPADIYSLGAILYALLTSRAPFVGDSPSVTILQVLNNEPVPLRALNPGVPRDLETICLKCLQKEPHKRYGTAELLADDLDRFLDGRPVEARPVSPAERLWRWSRKRPALASLAILVLLIATVSPLAATQFYLLAEQRELARREAIDTGRKLQQALQKAQAAEVAAGAAAHRERGRRFASEVGLIGFHWQLGNLSEAQRLLAAQVPKPGEPDLREFVWYYWSQRLQTQQTNAPITTPMAYAVHTVTSNDGSLVAFAGSAGSIVVRRLNSLASNVEDKVLPAPGTTTRILGISFVDGNDTLAVREDQQIALWDLSQTSPMREVWLERANLRSSAFSENGRFLAILSTTDLDVWDVVERRKLHSLALPEPKQGQSRFNSPSLRISRDGTRVLTNTGVWDLRKNELAPAFDTPRNEATTIDWAPGEQEFVVRDHRGRLTSWNGRNSESLLAEKVTTFAVSQKRREVAWATTRDVHVRDWGDSQEERVIYQRGVAALRYDPNGQELLGVDFRNWRRWPIHAPDPDSIRILAEWTKDSRQALSPQGNYFVGSAMAQPIPDSFGSVQVWRTATGEPMPRIAAFSSANGLIGDNAIRGIAVADDGTVAICSMLGTVELSDGLTGAHIDSLQQKEPVKDVADGVRRGLMTVTISSNGETVVAGRLDGAILVWNRRAADSPWELDAKSHFLKPPLLAPDGSALMTFRQASNEATIWDLKTGKPIPGRAPWGRCFRYGQGWAFVQSSPAGLISIYDFATGLRKHDLGVHAGLISVTATPDSKNIATLSSDGSLIVWDARLQLPLMTMDTRPSLDANPGQVTFVEEGRVLALIQSDGRARYWRLPPALASRET